MVRITIAITFVLVTTAPLLAQNRTWQDSTGRFTLDAEFVSCDGELVMLERADGNRVSLPISKLSNADQRWVKARLRSEKAEGETEAETPVGSQYEEGMEAADAVEKYWVAPYKDRLTFVMPWDSERPEQARICPAGETRQIWLDCDGHRLKAGKHSLRVVVSAKRLHDAPAPSPDQIRARIQSLAGQVAQRSYWYPWRECKPDKEPCPYGASFADAVRKAGRRDDLPEFVLWTPSAWIGIPPCLLPPTLDDNNHADAAFCLDEWEPVCLTVTNLSEADLEFDVQLFTTKEAERQSRDPLVRQVDVDLAIWPLRLPPSARMSVFTFNYGKGDQEYIAVLKRMKCNWFSLGNPRFTINGDKIDCDFEITDRTLNAVRPHGKGVFIYSMLMEFVQQVEKDAQIKPGDPRFEPLLRSYLTQVVQYMQSEGWKPEDYAVQLWDEPGLKGRDDPDSVFPLIQHAARIMKEEEPGVQIMVNPLLKPEQIQYYAMIDEETAIWCPHQGAVYSTEDMRRLRWNRARLLDPSKQGQLVLQGYLKTSRDKLGSKLWTYFNRDFPYSPIVYYRHMPWKNKWMDFDGVSFFASWYVTGGTLQDPGYMQTRQWWLYSLKDLYGWREGIEDIQYLEMAEDMARTHRSQSRRIMTAYESALKRVVDQGWWAKDPLLLEQAITTSRRELAEAMIKARPTKP